MNLLSEFRNTVEKLSNGRLELMFVLLFSKKKIFGIVLEEKISKFLFFFEDFFP
jgi:hypothetical protein